MKLQEKYMEKRKKLCTWKQTPSLSSISLLPPEHGEHFAMEGNEEAKESKAVRDIHNILEKVRNNIEGHEHSLENEELIEDLQEAMLKLLKIKAGGAEAVRSARQNAVAWLYMAVDLVEHWPECRPLEECTMENRQVIDLIDQISAEVEPMKQELLLSLASGCPEVCHYARLAKALNAAQLRLDAVEACGQETIRAYRRAAVQRVSLLLRFLDHAGEMGVGFGPAVEDNVGGAGNLLDTAPLAEVRETLHEANLLKAEMLGLCHSTNMSETPTKTALQEEDYKTTEIVVENEGQRHQTLSGLQRQLLALQARLDEVQSGRNPYVRKERRRAVLEVQALLSHGDLLNALDEWKIKMGAENEGTQPVHPAEALAWKVQQELCELQRQVLSFSGRHGDKDYLFLEELLTTQLLALDAVETHGDRSARDVRRSAVTTAQGMLSYLDIKSDDIDD
uniref:BAG family molecular chaperone regulator 5-like isoform X2 n=2 Tax=Myxine glutinosa TaxID=7769 RepID=UPI00358FBE5F